jgi:predicted nucleic acid-binding protein
VTLCDAGPLVALIDARDKNHPACVSALPTLSAPLLTTWPCLTEAMYLLGEHGGHRDQEKLWQLIEAGTLKVYASTEVEQTRMRALMQKYSNVPMDFADASLVAAAEVLGLSRIFTTDTDFYIYRIGDKKAFEVVPSLV